MGDRFAPSPEGEVTQEANARAGEPINAWIGSRNETVLRDGRSIPDAASSFGSRALCNPLVHSHVYRHPSMYGVETCSATR